MTNKEQFEQVPTTHTGDKVLRRRRRPKGILHTISRIIQRLFKGTSGK